ncbi:MAG: D-hexose-6-phosphate mutarotase [Saprospiraceae bacterium]|nr:D-hexose-6-phosphate mutarotase [Saprospiraceae bacterium]
MIIGNSQIKVCTKGAQVVHWQPKHATQPVLFCSDKADLDGPLAIRGGIPICWPWFGPNEGLPQHGFVRTREWHLVEHRVTEGDFYALLETTSDDNTESIWPGHWKLTCEIEAKAELTVRLTTHNLGVEPLYITQALHTYFQIADIPQVEIEGLDQVSYIDKVNGGVISSQNGPIIINEETDRIYYHPGNVVIDDQGNQRKIQITNTGADAVVVWNPWLEKCNAIKDLNPADYKKFVCVESAKVVEAVKVNGQTHNTLQTIISIENYQTNSKLL